MFIKLPECIDETSKHTIISIGFIPDNLKEYACNILHIKNNFELKNKINELSYIKSYEFHQFIMTYNLCSEKAKSKLYSYLYKNLNYVQNYFGCNNSSSSMMKNNYLFNVPALNMYLDKNNNKNMLLYKYNLNNLNKRTPYDLGIMITCGIDGTNIFKDNIDLFINYLNMSRIETLYNFSIKNNKNIIFKSELTPLNTRNNMIFYKNNEIYKNNISLNICDDININYNTSQLQHNVKHINKEDMFIKNYLKTNLMTKEIIIQNDKLKQIRKIEKAINDVNNEQYEKWALKMKNFENKGWVYDGYDNGGDSIVLLYKNKIYAKGVILSNNRVVEFPKELQEVFYIQNIRAYIQLRDARIYRATGSGFYPHLGQGYTRNRSSSGLCIGNLSNAHIDKLVNLPSNLELLYYNSMHGNFPEYVVRLLHGGSFSSMREIKRRYPSLSREFSDLLNTIEEKYLCCLTNSTTSSTGEIFVS